LPEVLGALDEPFADSSAIPTYLVSRETQRHVKVALSGDGGDELFAGYRSYLGEYWRERYRMVPALLRESIIEPLITALPDSRETRIGEALRRAKKFIRLPTAPSTNACWRSRRFSRRPRGISFWRAAAAELIRPSPGCGTC
jgi:asparagine synthase (glutamine-hydrolysing)